MLNKNKSQKQNVSKYGLILPLLAVFIITFNIKTVAQTTTPKVGNNTEVINNKTPLFVINGKKSSEKEFDKLNTTPGKIKSVTVLKDKKAFEKYGEEAKNGVVEVRTSNKKDKTTETNIRVEGYSGDSGSPLIIVDGKKMGRKQFKKLNLAAENIEKVDVLKDEAATKKYGKKAKNGVVEITTKK